MMVNADTSRAVLGANVQPGQTIKDLGRWYTVIGWIDYDDSHGTRVANATTAKGAATTVVILADLKYPVRQDGKPGGVPVTVRNWREKGNEVTIEISYRKRKYGGWDVVRADNGRSFGWLTRDEHGWWSARIRSEAFLGSGPDDMGHSFDTVPNHLFNGDSSITCRAIGVDEKRDEAATLIVAWLVDKGAPAVGFGEHYDVRRWADR